MSGLDPRERATRVAHSMRGSAAVLGLAELESTCATIELFRKNRESVPVETKASWARATARAVASLESWLRNYEG